MDDGADRVALVCVRDHRRAGLQVLMQPAAGEGGGRGEALSFPGGSVDRGDSAGPALQRCCGLTGGQARRLLGHRTSPVNALASWVAAARVLLAATGLLFVVEGAQRVPVRKKVPLRERRALSRGALDFAALLAREELYCDLSRLLFFVEWRDPGSGNARRFFLAQVDQGLRAAGASWHTPEAVLLLWRDGGVSLDFETFACLRILTDFSSCESLLSEYRARIAAPVRE